jgi:hypothetical protein
LEDKTAKDSKDFAHLIVRPDMNAFLKWMLIGLGGLVLLVVLFYAEEDLRGWHAWNQFKHQWEAKGVRFDFASSVPPVVPDDQNFALSPVWVAEINLLWQGNPERAKSWYGDRVDDEGVSKLVARLPVSVSGLTGNNVNSRQLPQLPAMSGNWATAITVDLTPWQSYYRDMQRANPAANIPVAAQSQAPAADVLLALSKFDPVLEELQQDSALPDSRFPVIYTADDPAAILLPHLAVIKRYALALQLRALAELQNKQPEKALADVKLMLRLTGSIRNEPFLISHLVRIAIVSIALQPVWEGLTAHQWSDAQLAELDAELAKLNLLADYKLTMHGELVFQGGVIDYLRHHPEQISNYSGDGNSRSMPLLVRIGWHLVPRGWYYQNQLSCARPMVELFIPLADETRRIISPTASRHADAAVLAETRRLNRHNAIEKMLLPGLGGSVRRFAYGQETADLARVAVALERFRLAHGEYPTALNALEPRFLDKVPQDIINGQPLHYSLSTGWKYTLYSVGWNEKDDGGHVVSTKGGAIDNSAGDWVWQN